MFDAFRLLSRPSIRRRLPTPAGTTGAMRGAEAIPIVEGALNEVHARDHPARSRCVVVLVDGLYRLLECAAAARHESRHVFLSVCFGRSCSFARDASPCGSLSFVSLLNEGAGRVGQRRG